MSKKIGELVNFHNENFFEGAVQLRWVQEREAQARLAASAFVFHGPRYHGAGDAEGDGFAGGYRLKDSASFVSDLLGSINSGLQGEEVNPYWLVVAGYGSGKSHLALACATLLGDPHGETAQKIVANIVQADTVIGAKVQEDIARLARPVLVLALDGMAGFNLGNALSQAVFSQLRRYGVDAGAIRALSPRFQSAEQFVERNFSFRMDRFTQCLPGLTAQNICARLADNDEAIYSAVDAVYTEANGSAIPMVGQESAQELIKTLCDVYCGSDGAFSSIVILFDEFGRYLEYAAEKPQLAGDAALQQLFQGVQDNSTKVRFIGLIQYELKAYLKRFGSVDLRQLQRYITRFDSAQKWYLSTNLETIFAHMIGKKQPAIEQAWQQADAQTSWQACWKKMRLCLPGYERYPVWNDLERFTRVIAQGCWPLHPLATWFLTRQRDVVQSRSALTFIKEMIDRISGELALSDGRLRQVSAAELVLSSMLPELISAERETGSTVAETLQLLLEKFQAHLNAEQRLVLAGVAILEKMRIGKQSQDDMNGLLCEATALPASALAKALSVLSQDLGAMEWNRDLGQYELIADASTRGQFQQWLRKNQAVLSPDAISDLFVRRGGADTDLSDVTTDFAQRNNISTLEWRFEALFAHSLILEQSIKRIFQEWSQATTPSEAKGKLIYLYLHPEEDVAGVETTAAALMQSELVRYGYDAAPVWLIVIADRQGRVAEHIGRLYLFDERISVEERERFRRFVPEERERSSDALKEAAQEAIRERLYWIAGQTVVPDGRLRKVGEEIFARVYPHALPFVFDGFATSAGGGPADCAQLTRSLIAHQVEGSWVQAQPKRLQNRVHATLVASWMALPPSGKLTEPAEEKVRVAYQWLQKIHQDNPTRSLWQSYKALIAPPYGMNASSAGLLLSLMLGGNHPPRRIERKGVMVASGDWVNDAFPAQKGRHYLEQTILEQSTVRFLSDDAEGRWRNLLGRWETEQNYQAMGVLADEVERMHRIEPRPEVLDGLYFHLRERSDHAIEKLLSTQKKLEECERGVENAARKENVGEFLRIGSQLVSHKQLMEADACWPIACIESYTALLVPLREFLAPLLHKWMARQSCHTAAQVSDFRHLMRKSVESLKVLSFDAEARALDQQMMQSIAQVEARQKFSLSLDQSDDYPRQPDPTESTPVREMRDAMLEGDRLIQCVQSASSVLKEEEIHARTEAITKRQQRLRSAIERQTNALGGLFKLVLENEGALHDALIKSRNLKEIFQKTKDQNEVSEIVIQLERILADLAVWEGSEVSVDRLVELLQLRVRYQVDEMVKFLDALEIDAAWDLEGIYQSLAFDRVDTARRRSTAWLAPRLMQDTQMHALNKARCVVLERELNAAPAYLSHLDQAQVDAMLEEVRCRHAEIEEHERRDRVLFWQKPFLNLYAIHELGRHEIEGMLKKLHNPPDELLMHEKVLLGPIELDLIAHLDQMGMDEIVGRIERLPLNVQHKLLVILTDRLTLIVA
ncbi:MAG: hypothetical protein H7240_02740 [Glaciimonas sp.]|nr:hypothetical protein [Glaciimonas sp.]